MSLRVTSKFLLPLPFVTTLALIGCASAPQQALTPPSAFEAEALLALDHWASALQLEADGEPMDRPSLQALADAALDKAMACADQPDCRADLLLRRVAELSRAHAAGASTVALNEEGDAMASDGSLMSTDLVHAAAAEAVQGSPPARFGGRDLAEVIVLNEPVRAALNEWLTWMRPQLLESLDNYQSLRGDMWPAFERAGLPEALLFGILAKESNAKVHAVSRAGAAGPLQFMPATGHRFGLGRVSNGFDTRFEPAAAAEAAVRYLNERFAEYDHDLTMALAAYNGGEGRLLRLHRQFPRASYWDAAIQSRLPKETRDYVPMVLAAAWIFLHADEFGIELPSAIVPAVDLVLQKPASLNALSICLGQGDSRNGWFRALRNQNPQWLPHVELAAGTTIRLPSGLEAHYTERCVDGPVAELAAQIAGAAKQHFASAAVAERYTVRRGDTLASIARRHQCDTKQLASINNVKAPRYLIRPGQGLRLAGCRG